MLSQCRRQPHRALFPLRRLFNGVNPLSSADLASRPTRKPVESLEIVKPAGNWVASISAGERRNYNSQAGFEAKLLAKIAAVNSTGGELSSRAGHAAPGDKGFDPYEAIADLQRLAAGQTPGLRTVGRRDLAFGGKTLSRHERATEGRGATIFPYENAPSVGRRDSDRWADRGRYVRVGSGAGKAGCFDCH